MFGFKIIKESEYNELTKVKEQLDDKTRRLQLLGNLNNLYVLKSEDYPCGKCKGETDKCMKLTFANQTICVVEKKYVNDFTRRKTTVKRSKK